MTLISCKECSKQISDKAATCPQCGAPQSSLESDLAVDSLPTLSQVQQAASSGKLDEAQNMMARVLKAHPNNAKSHFVRAKLFAMQGKFENAEHELRTAEKLQPDLSFATPHAIQELKKQLASKLNVPEQESNLASVAAKSPPKNQSSKQRKKITTEHENTTDHNDVNIDWIVFDCPKLQGPTNARGTSESSSGKF